VGQKLKGEKSLTLRLNDVGKWDKKSVCFESLVQVGRWSSYKNTYHKTSVSDEVNGGTKLRKENLSKGRGG
jgi:hypothetical protein